MLTEVLILCCLIGAGSAVPVTNSNEVRQIVREVLAEESRSFLEYISISLSQIAGTRPVPSDTCGGPGWRRVTLINMSDPNHDCPQGLSLTDYSNRSCGRSTEQSEQAFSCSTVTFPVSERYSQVCGRAKAYQSQTNTAFLGHIVNNQGIDGAYVDGLSLTHGSPRSHIWTFASGQLVSTDALGLLRCPCDDGKSPRSPLFVGSDYFCESATGTINPNDALWDGQSCNNACCRHNNPPWFKKTLPSPGTSDDIEMRLCFSSSEQAGIGIELLELYVS